MLKYFSFMNFGNLLYKMAQNGAPKQGLTSYLGQQKCTWFLFKYMRMRNHPELIRFPFLSYFYPLMAMEADPAFAEVLWGHFPKGIFPNWKAWNFDNILCFLGPHQMKSLIIFWFPKTPNPTSPIFEHFPTETWDFLDFLTTPPPIWTVSQVSPLFSLESFPNWY